MDVSIETSMPKGTSLNDVLRFLAILDLPTYPTLSYNVQFFGLFWTPLTTLKSDVIKVVPWACLPTSCTQPAPILSDLISFLLIILGKTEIVFPSLIPSFRRSKWNTNYQIIVEIWSKFVLVMSVAVLQFIHSMMSERCLFLYISFYSHNLKRNSLWLHTHIRKP